MKHYSVWLAAIAVLFFCQNAQAQTNSSEVDRLSFSEQRYRHSRTLALTLGGYALANIAVSSLAMGQTSGEARYAHQMNVYWNAVNAGIAGLGLLGLRKQHPATETLGEAIRQHEAIKRTLLFNTGLDVAYIAGGLYLTERANSHPDEADRLRGFGKTVMVQGAFLLVFDAANYLIFSKRGDAQQVRLIGSGPLGVGIAVTLR
jgi:hypothetical protein